MWAHSREITTLYSLHHPVVRSYVGSYPMEILVPKACEPWECTPGTNIIHPFFTVCPERGNASSWGIYEFLSIIVATKRKYVVSLHGMSLLLIHRKNVYASATISSFDWLQIVSMTRTSHCTSHLFYFLLKQSQKYSPKRELERG